MNDYSLGLQPTSPQTFLAAKAYSRYSETFLLLMKISMSKESILDTQKVWYGIISLATTRSKGYKFAMSSGYEEIQAGVEEFSGVQGKISPF